MVSRKSGPSCLKKVENRLLTTLLLSVAYPILSAGFFAIFVFLIVPPSPALNGVAYPWLYIYWLVAAGAWLILLGAILPLMRGDIREEGPTSRDLTYDIDLKRMTNKGSCDLLSDLEMGETGSRRSSHSSHSKIEKEENESSVKDLDDDISHKSLEDLDLKFDVDESKAVVHSSQLEEEDDEDDDEVGYQVVTTLKTEKERSNERLVELVEQQGAIDHEEHSVEQTFKQPLEPNHELCIETAATKTTTRSFESAVKTSEVVHESYEYSLPSPSAVSGGGTPNKNTVFLFVNNDNV